MKKKTFFLLILIIIIITLLNYNFFNFIFNYQYDLLKWENNQFKKNRSLLNKRINDSKKTLESYYNKKPLDKISYEIVPIYDLELIQRQYTLNYLDYNILGKKDSLPTIINYFTTPIKLNGKWVGDSLFRINYKDRGKNNNLKEKYMFALQNDDIKKYSIKMNNYFIKKFNIIKGKELNFYRLYQNICIDLFFELHFDLKPTKEDYNDVYIFIDSVRFFYDTKYLNKYVTKQIFNLQKFYNKTIKRINIIEKQSNHCLVKKWLDRKSIHNKGDIFLEIIHNILALVINWFNIIYPYTLNINNKNIPRYNINNDINQYLYESIRFICPVRFITSSIENNKIYNLEKGKYLHLYDIKPTLNNNKYFGKNTQKFDINRFKDYHKHIVKNSNLKNKCPFFNSKKNAKILCNQEIIERKGYIPFGEGYRRCPGEILTMKFFELFIKNLNNYKFEINLPNNISKKEKFIWGEIEKNYLIKFN